MVRKLFRCGVFTQRVLGGERWFSAPKVSKVSSASQATYGVVSLPNSENGSAEEKTSDIVRFGHHGSFITVLHYHVGSFTREIHVFAWECIDTPEIHDL